MLEGTLLNCLARSCARQKLYLKNFFCLKMILWIVLNPKKRPEKVLEFISLCIFKCLSIPSNLSQLWDVVDVSLLVKMSFGKLAFVAKLTRYITNF